MNQVTDQKGNTHQSNVDVGHQRVCHQEWFRCVDGWFFRCDEVIITDRPHARIIVIAVVLQKQQQQKNNKMKTQCEQ